MDGRYAIIGWGSLIWDLEILTPHVDLPWAMHAGPSLPMEFSRISAKRKQALAVCLDAEHGAHCPTHVVPSRRTTLADAITDLAARERAPRERIGGICRPTGQHQGRETFVDQVRDWCDAQGWRGAVWTDLGSNFNDLSDQPFSIDAADTYLRSLTGEQLLEAVRYISNAPAATDTPLRRALMQRDWWRDEMTRHGFAATDPAIR